MNIENCQIPPSFYAVVDPLTDTFIYRLENLALPYNGFAHQADRTLGEGLKDICTLYRARAFKVDLDPRSSQFSDSNKSNFTEVGTNPEILGAALFAIPHTPTTSALCIELVGSRFLRQMVRILVVSAAADNPRPQGLL